MILNEYDILYEFREPIPQPEDWLSKGTKLIKDFGD